ncbi:hypothetical protein [Limnohabitans sp. 2KL-51]|uniref:hypothetical protein n=1 Tax=Limnohabitans sp. 2KL-51 TaxID=1977911 RepID=UPI000D3C85D0|nr:hypothetical protein [Limnohabitans sp. 2KL-51]PUE48578.1 hypothetical protein B9Z49_07500 [Limnohabitans sp. 2KL-51]
MNMRDIRTSSDPDLAGSYAAIQRAAKSAEDLAIKTNTAIIVAVDGKPVRITAAELLKMRELESAKPTPNIPTL